jgi:zinc/manganese transport system substrate-binding protein
VSGADVIVMNGLGLDDWLQRVIDSTAGTAPVVRLAENLPGVDYVAGEAGDAYNPHLWLDVRYAARYATRIADTLAAADPAKADAFRAGGDAFAARLNALDAVVRGQVAIPGQPEARLVP